MNRVRTVKSKDFSVIDNKIFRNASLSLKAKGLLCTMLSFAESWDLSISGLSRFCKCGKTQIKTALDEIVKQGYLVKDKQIRDEKGKFAGYEWILVDEPFSFDSSKSNEKVTKMCDFPQRKIGGGKSAAENRTQININQQVSSNKYQSIINHDRIDEFIEKAKREFEIELTPEAVNRLIDVNADLIYWFSVLKSAIEHSRTNNEPIKDMIRYMLGFPGKHQTAIEYNPVQIKQNLSQEQLNQVRSTYDHPKADPNSEFWRFKPGETMKQHEGA